MAVRESVAFAFDLVCDRHPRALTSPPSFTRQVTECLVKGLEAEPLVAKRVCEALASMVTAVYDAAKGAGSEVKSFELSPVEFELVVTKVLDTSKRPDAVQRKLGTASYDAVGQMMRCVPEECSATLLKVVDTLIERLQAAAVRSRAVAAQDRHAVELAETQMLEVIDTLSSCIENTEIMGSPGMEVEIQQRAPTVIPIILRLMEHQNEGACVVTQKELPCRGCSQGSRTRSDADFYTDSQSNIQPTHRCITGSAGASPVKQNQHRN